MEQKHTSRSDSSARSLPLGYIKTILRAIRQHDLSFPETRVALTILEFGQATGRRAAAITRQDFFSILDGKMDKQKVSLVIRKLIRKRVIERGDGIYSFRPSVEWLVPLRTPQGRRSEQLELERLIDQTALQLDLNLYDLDHSLKIEFEETAVVPQTTAVVSQTTRSVVPQTTAVVSQTTAPNSHTNVGSNVINEQRSTLLAQRLERLKEFFAETDGMAQANAEISPSRSLGFWRGLVRSEWDRIETEMGEIRMQEQTGYKSESRIKRLTWLMTEALQPGSDRWKRIFPGTR